MSSMATLSPEFHNFLYAPIGGGRNEMPFSVISASAPLDLDPWREAADLAGMPANGAASRLSRVLAGFVDEQPEPDRSMRAARLGALLPQAKTSDVGAAADVQKRPRFSLLAMLCLARLASTATTFVMATLSSGHGLFGQRSKPIASSSRVMASTNPAPPSPH
jgi:hypothetical protein